MDFKLFSLTEVIPRFIINLGKMMNKDDTRWEGDCTCVCACRAMPQRKFYCECRKGRLPDLTSDMCRLLSYRSLNGLVRNHRLDGDKDRKWRRDEEGRSSMVEVKVGKSSAVRVGWPSWPLSYRFLNADTLDASYAQSRDWLIMLLSLIDKWVKSSSTRRKVSVTAKIRVPISVTPQ